MLVSPASQSIQHKYPMNSSALERSEEEHFIQR